MRGGPLAWRRAFVLANTLFVYVVMRFGISVGGFVPKTYVQQVVENSDFRKYDDGLRMILDCTPELERALTKILAEGGLGRHRALRPAPAGRGDDDLLHAVGAAQRPRAFHRRRARRLRLGGDGAEGDGGVNCRQFGFGSASRPGMTVTTARPWSGPWVGSCCVTTRRANQSARRISVQPLAQKYSDFQNS